MKDAYEVLKQKETELARIRHEVESLRIVSTLLLDDSNSEQSKAHLMTTDDLLDIVREHAASSEPAGIAGHLFSSILKKLA